MTSNLGLPDDTDAAPLFVSQNTLET